MRDKMHFDTVPCNEKCEQLGPNYNPVQARKEAETFLNQIVRACGEPPETAKFVVTSCFHEFGSYYSVVLNFDCNNQKEVDYAYDVDSNLPVIWDSESRQNLGL